MTATRRILVGICTLILAACSSAHESASSTSPPPSVGTAAPTTAPRVAPVTGDTAAPTTVTSAGAAASSEPASPLAAFFGNVASDGGTNDDAAMQREQQSYQEALARCMKEQGFDYVPFVLPLRFSFRREGVGVISLADGEPSLPPDQFAKQYGYGISTMDKSTDTAPVDPNDALVDAMSAPERVAYYHALYGPKVALQKDGRLAHKELDIDDSSCFTKAGIESQADQVTVTTSAVLSTFAPLIDEMGALTQRELADARMVAATQAWTDCMAGAGYPGYTDLNAPRQDVADRATTVMGQARDASKADPDKLAALRAFEIAVATADLQCRVPYDAAFLAVSVDVEQAFIDAHRAELEQYRDALAASATGG